ncbi:hypothetical protein QYM36_000476, partial [Artemia franciscana]
MLEEDVTPLPLFLKAHVIGLRCVLQISLAHSRAAVLEIACEARDEQFASLVLDLYHRSCDWSGSGGQQLSVVTTVWGLTGGNQSSPLVSASGNQGYQGNNKTYIGPPVQGNYRQGLTNSFVGSGGHQQDAQYGPSSLNTAAMVAAAATATATATASVVALQERPDMGQFGQ